MIQPILKSSIIDEQMTYRSVAVQFVMTVMGGGATCSSSARTLTRKRWPSAVTS
jgi:hypothetical protein